MPPTEDDSYAVLFPPSSTSSFIKEEQEVWIYGVTVHPPPPPIQSFIRLCPVYPGSLLVFSDLLLDC